MDRINASKEKDRDTSAFDKIAYQSITQHRHKKTSVAKWHKNNDICHQTK